MIWSQGSWMAPKRLQWTLDINIYSETKFRWNRTMLHFPAFFLAAILKILGDEQFLSPVMKTRHQYLFRYQISLKSDNVAFSRLFWQPFWKWRTTNNFWQLKWSRDINIYLETNFHLNRSLFLIFCDFFKISSGGHFEMAAILKISRSNGITSHGELFLAKVS